MESVLGVEDPPQDSGHSLSLPMSLLARAHLDVCVSTSMRACVRESVCACV